MGIEYKMQEFLAQTDEESYLVYENKLIVFRGYLYSKKVNYMKEYYQEINLIDIIAKLEKKDVCESIKYYIEERDIHYVSTIRTYISVVKEFIRYIGNNVVLIKEFGQGDSRKDNSFDASMEEFIAYLQKSKEYMIYECRDMRALEDEEYKQLYKYCDKYIAELDECELKYKENGRGDRDLNRNHAKYVGALAVKLIMFTGMRFEILQQLRIDEKKFCESQEGKFEIRYVYKSRGKKGEKKKNECFHYRVKLPESLFQELREYCIYKKNADIESEWLFCYRDGTKVKNDIVNNIMKEVGDVEVSGVMRIVKYRIIELIERGTNQSIIQRITGVGDKVFGECQEKVNEKKTNQKRDEYINEQLSKECITTELW